MALVNRRLNLIAAVIVPALTLIVPARSSVQLWNKVEMTFTSSVDYADPLYDVRVFKLELTSPCGRTEVVHGSVFSLLLP